MPNFDHRIIADTQPFKMPSFREGLLAGIQDVRDAQQGQRMESFRGQAMSELGNEKPNMNKLLSGYASVDPVAAMKTQAGMKTVDPTKKSIRELEQLWKDAERSLRYAKQQGDSVGANYYTRLQKKLTDQLKVLRPEIWGDTPTETINNGTVKEEVGAPAITDTKVIKKALQDSAKDADKDGLIDNVTSWRDTITEWKRENKLADDRSEVKDVMVFAENLISEIADKHRGVLEKINRGQDDRKQRMTEDEKYQKVEQEWRARREDVTQRLDYSVNDANAIAAAGHETALFCLSCKRHQLPTPINECPVCYSHRVRVVELTEDYLRTLLHRLKCMP